MSPKLETANYSFANGIWGPREALQTWSGEKLKVEMGEKVTSSAGHASYSDKLLTQQLLRPGDSVS
jgi:hypothetical protein